MIFFETLTNSPNSEFQLTHKWGMDRQRCLKISRCGQH